MAIEKERERDDDGDDDDDDDDDDEAVIICVISVRWRWFTWMCFTHLYTSNQLPSAFGASLTRAGHTMTTHCGHRLHRQTYSELFGAHLRFGLHSADVG